jgi:predicted branched-subunit amino acid permease
MPESITPDTAWRTGSREALGAPALVLAIGYIGYGSLAQSQGFSLLNSVLSTICIWALPGQLILIESSAVHAPALAILLAVVFSASRFLPMTVALMPHLRSPGVPSWRYYFAGHVLAMTSWAVAIRRYPQQPQAARLPYFTGYAVTLWVVSMASTVVGFELAGALPAPIRLAFLFANPLFFILVLTADRPERMVALALGCGAVLGPLIHLVLPSWSVIGGGVVGGTLAFLLGSRRDD